MRLPMTLLCLLGATTTPALASSDTTPTQLLAEWQAAAGTTAVFSAARGRQLYQKSAGDWSCSTCHTADPRAPGKHAVTGKAILPLAPSVNPQRFSDRAKVEKWFRRNCHDVLGRECGASEKGDLLSWLLTLN